MDNPFQIKDEASRYDKFRPRYHSTIFLHYKEAHEIPFKFCLDVCCGTGHSTVALSEFSSKTVGCDLAGSMLEQARKNADLEFIQCDASALPFAENAFDFINVSMGFHWLDQDEFLSESQRVLTPGGYLSIDNYGFSGTISEDPTKQQLHHDFIVQNLPSPPRKPSFPEEKTASAKGFHLIERFEFREERVLSKDQFINFAKTWSNFQVLEPEVKQQVSDSMNEVYQKIFEDQSLKLGFEGRAHLFQSANS